MRIIAGQYKGRRIAAPPESVTRPTVDRVREAMFSSLESTWGCLDGACVLDAFSGSGAMALEALSRGAASVCMLDRSREAYKVICDNIRQLGISSNVAVAKMADVFSDATLLPDGMKFDIVFLDPPYSCAPKDVIGLLDRLKCAGRLASNALFVYEHDKASSDAADEAYRGSDLRLIKRRNYGRVVVDTLEQDICANI